MGEMGLSFDDLINELVRANDIQSFCNNHSISTLMHFTRIENLDTILEHGLLTRERLEEPDQKITPTFNDSLRLDNVKASVSLSISFPNYKMLYKYRCSARGDWAVLLLHANLLWELDCLFCHSNAASNQIRDVPFDERRKIGALIFLFQDYHPNQRKSLDIPDSYPTDPQAEVLVLDAVPPTYISELHFFSSLSWQNWKTMSRINHNLPINCQSPYFSPRCDWLYWTVS